MCRAKPALKRFPTKSLREHQPRYRDTQPFRLRAMKRIAITAVVVLIIAAIVYLILRRMNRVSYLGDMSLPRGMRNNNPGNLIISNEKWHGKVHREQNTDGKFEQFYYYVDGVRAMIIDLKGDIKEGTNTVRKLVHEYAPDSELTNDTESYIASVSSQTGFNPDQVLIPDEATLDKIVRAITSFENGRVAVNSSQFKQAWNLV